MKTKSIMGGTTATQIADNWRKYDVSKTDKLVLKDSTKTKVACWQLINERTKVVYADIYSDGLAEMIAAHDYKVTS